MQVEHLELFHAHARLYSLQRRAQQVLLPFLVPHAFEPITRRIGNAMQRLGARGVVAERTLTRPMATLSHRMGEGLGGRVRLFPRPELISNPPTRLSQQPRLERAMPRVGLE